MTKFLLSNLYILNAVSYPYVAYVCNVGRGQLSSEWRHNENDVIIAGLWRYGNWRHVATGCNALVFYLNLFEFWPYLATQNEQNSLSPVSTPKTLFQKLHHYLYELIRISTGVLRKFLLHTDLPVCFCFWSNINLTRIYRVFVLLNHSAKKLKLRRVLDTLFGAFERRLRVRL